MGLSNILSGGFGKSEDFIIGKDDFADLTIKPTGTDSFYYFYHEKEKRLIKQFLLLQKDRVDYICQVTLIKKDEKFTPRLCLSTRDKARKIVETPAGQEEKELLIKANVNLADCHENFWKLVSFLQSLRELEIPVGSFSLVAQGEAEIVSALRGRDAASIVSIIKELSSTEGLNFGKDDLNELLKRREKLEKFKRGMDAKLADEGKWQVFFEQNKWIFGYGLDYQILKQEQSQPNYGGTKVDGTGGERGDYLTSTSGDLSFTVLVEIKTPATPLLRGTSEIRNGAWSLSKELTDAVSQIQANIETWDKEGSRTDGNRDELETKGVYTVQPKGIIVIGSLSELDERSKRGTFQRLRKSLHGIDILTFDELYERARFIVETRDLI